MVDTYSDKVSVKLDGKYVLFRKVSVSQNEAATFPAKPLDIQLELENGAVIHDDGSRVEVIVRTCKESKKLLTFLEIEAVL